MPIYRLKEGSTQWKFRKSRNKVQIFGGAFANGKSTGLIMKTLEIVKNYPGCLCCLGRATYPKLNDTLRKDFMEWAPKGWVKRGPTQDDNTCYFNNGSVVQFRYIAQKGKSREDGTTTSNLLSATYDLVAIDQIEDPEISHKDFLDMLGRLRRKTPYRPDDGDEDDTMPSTGPRWLLLGANPAHNWFYREIVYPYILWRDKRVFSDKLIVDEATGEPLIDLLESSTYENADNLEPDYIKTLEAAYKGQMRDRYLLGKWAAFEGLVHPTFDHNRNVMKRDLMLDYLDKLQERHVRVVMLEGYDFGLVSPSCYLIGFVDDYGRVFIIDGFYQGEFNYMDQPDAIAELRAKYTRWFQVREPILADPAIFKKMIVQKRQTGTTIASEFTGMGIQMRAADNSIITGIAKVNAYINGKNGVPHIVTGDDPGPLLYVAEELTWWLDEVGSYYWKRNPQMAFTDEPIDNNDHAMNTTKYLLSRLPEPSKIIIPRNRLPPGWMMWQEMNDKDFKRVSHTAKRLR